MKVRDGKQGKSLYIYACKSSTCVEYPTIKINNQSINNDIVQLFNFESVNTFSVDICLIKLIKVLFLK